MWNARTNLSLRAIVFYIVCRDPTTVPTLVYLISSKFDTSADTETKTPAPTP